MEESTSYSSSNRIPELAAKIAAHAQARGWSLAKLVREFPALGSERTFRDMQDGRYKGYNLEAQEANLAAAASLIDDLTDAAGGEGVCETLSAVLEVRRAALEAMSAPSSDISRLVLVRGEAGAGKTKAAEALAGFYGSRIARMEADETMKGSPSAFLGALLSALGKPAPSAAAAARMSAAVDALKQARRCVVIDEAHHLGVRNLNVLKTLVNRTPGEFLLLAIPKLWADLELGAYQEAVQLTTNRLSECVRISPTAADAAKFLAFARPDIYPDAKAAKGAAAQIMEYAAGRGNMKFVRKVARAVSFEAPEDEAKAVAAAIAAVRRKAGEGG